MRTSIQIGILYCAMFICATLAYAQGYDTCAYLAAWEDVKPQNAMQAQQQYDSLKFYIKLCASRDNDSWLAFTPLAGAVKLLSNDTNRYDQYRSWLISVIYFNATNPAYFCACLGAIAGTYQYGKYSPLGHLAVLNYVRRQHRECWGASGDEEYAQDSAYDADMGYLDDVDHLPSLDSLGLGFLLARSSVPNPEIGPSDQYFSSFTSSPNPFVKETTLEFNLKRMMYTSVKVYDELGRLVWGNGKGSSLEAGMHTITLDGKSLPQGTLYARISTGFGEVKTVKLIHD
ncbi:MAG: hypothetical protein Q8916_01785 [Bacteroidota bacterium]|nr:hypothetical protein [Bacteroidota bacterium]MDP4229118.1 hypothetical protein [Bacteroidota bacterium]MDP4236032.1 hypothetical protein [Bacteroidota bacterium]